MRKWIFPILSTIAAAIVSMMTYSRLPEEIAIHFSSSGAPDNWMSKPIGAFLLPALIILICLLMWLQIKFEKDEHKRRRGDAIVGSIMAIISVTLLAVHVITIAYNLGYDISIVTVVTILVGIIFILVGNLLPRLPQGGFMQWPKLPEPVRRKVSRFQGRMMIVLGFLFLLLSVLPNKYISPLFISLLAIYIVTLIGNIIHESKKA